MDLAVAQEAVMEWKRGEGCGCCEKWEITEAAQRKLADALDLASYTNYADELVICRPEDVPPPDDD